MSGQGDEDPIKIGDPGSVSTAVKSWLDLAKYPLHLLDHASDLAVIVDLHGTGRPRLALLGLGLDLLPGLFTFAQFLRLGHEWWRCALLLFHPVNFYLHSALAGGCQETSSFSARVALYSKEVQSQLEAPMQLIFTLTLICLR